MLSLKSRNLGNSHHGSVEMNLTSNHEDAGSNPGLAQLRIRCCLSCGVGCRCCSHLVLLWMWCRPAAIAQIQPLPWKPPSATGSTLKKDKKKKKKKLVFLAIFHYVLQISPEDNFCPYHVKYRSVFLKSLR